MKLSLRFRVVVATVMMMVALGRADAQDLVQAGEVKMAPPAGWSLERDPRGPVVLKRTDDGQLSAIVIASEPLEGSLPEAVRRAMHRGFIDTKLELNSLREGTSIFGHRGVSFDESFRHPQMRRRVKVCGLGLEVDGRLHLAWLTTMSNKATGERQEEFEQMIRTWQFKSSTRAAWNPAQPRKVPKDLAGFYWGSKIQNRYNGLSGSMEMKALRRYVLLLPTGQAYRGIPPGGRVLDMDFAERLREDPAQCGVYSVDGDDIVFEWEGALGMLRTERSPLQRRGRQAGFRFMGVNVSPVPPVSRLRVQGRYTSSNITMSNFGSSNTSVSSERTLALTSDGRYTKSGFVGVSFSHESDGGRSGGTGQSKAGKQTGTYVIDGYRLTLKPDEGPEENFTIMIETPGPSPGALFINGAAYLKSGG